MNEQPADFKKNDTFHEVLMLESKENVVADMGEAVDAHLMEIGWSAEEVHSFGLAVHEALANAIQHGILNIEEKEGESEEAYRARIGKTGEQAGHEDKKVKLMMDLSQTQAIVEVTTSDSSLTEEHFKSSPVGKEGDHHGWGGDMINSFADKWEIIPGGIRLIKYRS